MLLGPEKASTLPMFHALMGCDTVSFFVGRGKKTAWDVWNVYGDLTPVLKAFKTLTEDINRVHGRNREVRGSAVWPNKPPYESQWRKARTVLEKGKKPGQHSTYTSSTLTACQESSISRGLRIESDNSEATSAAKSFGLGMAVHGHHTGQPFRKRRILATNSSDAGVKLHVEDGANAWRQIWYVQVCAIVAATAARMNTSIHAGK